MSKPTLGQRFTVTHTLDRVKGYDKSLAIAVPGTLKHGEANHPIQSTRERYLNSEGGQPFEAVYIGYRYIKDGKLWWEDEVGYVFEPTSQKLAYLLVFDPRRKPVLALPDHCTLIDE